MVEHVAGRIGQQLTTGRGVDDGPLLHDNCHQSQQEYPDRIGWRQVSPSKNLVQRYDLRLYDGRIAVSKMYIRQIGEG